VRTRTSHALPRAAGAASRAHRLRRRLPRAQDGRRARHASPGRRARATRGRPSTGHPGVAGTARTARPRGYRRPDRPAPRCGGQQGSTRCRREGRRGRPGRRRPWSVLQQPADPGLTHPRHVGAPLVQRLGAGSQPHLHRVGDARGVGLHPRQRHDGVTSTGQLHRDRHWNGHDVLRWLPRGLEVDPLGLRVELGRGQRLEEGLWRLLVGRRHACTLATTARRRGGYQRRPRTRWHPAYRLLGVGRREWGHAPVPRRGHRPAHPEAG